MKNISQLVSVSIVSHNHGLLISKLLNDLQMYCSKEIEVILTINTEEKMAFKENDFSFPMHFIHNKIKKGFGANHNQAFKYAKGKFFCVLNPDIRLNENPFPALIDCLKDKANGVVAPTVRKEDGGIAENVRRFPTLLILLKKLLNLKKNYDYHLGTNVFSPDWIGGMFMLFPCKVFKEVNGFNEKYFLYYEDVDLCARLKLEGYKIIYSPAGTVIHHAQHDSHRKFLYFIWHVLSILRFFSSKAYISSMINKAFK